MDEGEADSGIEMVGGGGGGGEGFGGGRGGEASASKEESTVVDGDGIGKVEDKPEGAQDEAGSTKNAGERKSGCPVPTTAASTSGAAEEDAGAVFIRVFIHDQNLQRCYKFHLDEVVFNAKKKVSVHYSYRDWRCCYLLLTASFPSFYAMV